MPEQRRPPFRVPDDLVWRAAGAHFLANYGGDPTPADRAEFEESRWAHFHTMKAALVTVADDLITAARLQAERAAGGEDVLDG